MEGEVKNQPLFQVKETPTTEFYCNQAQMAVSIWDIIIDIGQTDTARITRSESGQPIVPVEYRARIIMSPQHAKAFSKMLSENILKYEQEFGEINIQPKQH